MLPFPDSTQLYEIPIMVNGVQLLVELPETKQTQLKNEQGQNPPAQQLNTQIDHILSSTCNHSLNQRCLNCIKTVKDEKGESDKIKKKCQHGPDGKCLNCIEDEKDKSKTKQEQKKWNCQHGPNGKCSHCIGDEFVQNTAHISFESYMEEKKLKCKGQHPPEGRCNNCLPPQEIKYQVKMDCKNHAPYPKAMCNQCLPPSIILKQQRYRHVDFAQFSNLKETQQFVQYWASKGHTVQRAGILYGYYAEDPSFDKGVRAVIEAIYEPPQQGEIGDVSFKHDKDAQLVDQVATFLNFERIGWIFTTISQDVFLSSHKVIQSAKLQQDYRAIHQSGYPVSKFITVVLRTGKDNPQDVKPEVYMISDQGQALIRDNLQDENQDNRKLIKLRKPKDSNDVLPAVIREGKQVQEFEPDFLLVKVAEGGNSKFRVIQNSDFPIENRDKELSKDDVVKYFYRHKQDKSWIKYCDFHLLIHLAKTLDIHTVSHICDCINEEKEINPFTEEIIKGYYPH